MTLDADFTHFSYARVLTGIGYGFFFVPLSVISYSQLRPDQNNRASSFTNFFRNWRGSFGVAFVTTMAERRQSFHQHRVGSNLTSTSAAFQNAISVLTHYLQQHGFTAAAAGRAATVRIYQGLIAQTQFLAFMDCFYVVGWITLLAAPIVLLATNVRGDGSEISAH